MKYLKYFEQASAYEAYKNGSDFITPNVSYIEESNSIEFNPYVIEKNIIHFVLNDINCEAEEGMTFKEWIFSDYFDINNSYNLYCGYSNNIRDHITDSESTNIRLLSIEGAAFNPEIYIEDYIIANMVYSSRTGGFDAQ